MVLRLVLWLVWLFLPVFVFAQQVKVTGTVTDEETTPLEFANVAVKGSSNGTQTNAAGKFKIAIPSK